MAGLTVTRQLEPIEGQQGTGGVRLKLECTEADDLPKDVFLYLATPSRYQIDSDEFGVEPWGEYYGVCSIADIWEYPADAPHPQCIYAYSFLSFIKQVEAQFPGQTLTVERLKEFAAVRDGKPKYTWPFFRKATVDIILKSQEDIDTFLLTAQEHLDILVDAATTQEDSLQDLTDWTFGSSGS
jgi:hypothetical protein